MSEENVQLVRSGIEAVNRRDLDALLALMDDDVESVSRIAALEGGLHGHPGVRQWWESWFESFPDYDIEIVDVHDHGEVVIASLRAWATVQEARSPLRTRSGMQAVGGAEFVSGGVSARQRRKPLKPPGCRSRRCRRRTWRSTRDGTGRS